MHPILKTNQVMTGAYPVRPYKMHFMVLLLTLGPEFKIFICSCQKFKLFLCGLYRDDSRAHCLSRYHDISSAKCDDDIVVYHLSLYVIIRVIDMWTHAILCAWEIENSKMSPLIRERYRYSPDGGLSVCADLAENFRFCYVRYLIRQPNLRFVFKCDQIGFQRNVFLS